MAHLNLDQQPKTFFSFTEAKPQHYVVDFLEKSQNYCVGIVDMVGSTKICAKLNRKKLSRYYEIFLNSMAQIIEKHEGFVIKNIGDCLLFYFPKSSDLQNEEAFRDCIECSLEMLQKHEEINKKINDENLPLLDYRISLDYGEVTIMKTNYSANIDVLGTPVNICIKINHAASKNEFVVGSDLYQIIKNFSNYKFRLIKSCSIGLKFVYPIYKVKK